MFKKILPTLLCLLVLTSVSLAPLPATAAATSISLTANKSTVATGSTVIIGIYMNGGGTAVNAVQADLSYPASKLQYIGYSASGSAFEIGASNGGGDGFASVTRGTVSSVSGSGLVGTMTFKALSGSGSATISIAGSSSLVSDGNPVPYGGYGVTVNFGVAAAAKPAAPAAPVAPKDTTAPVIKDVKYKDLTPFSATITWITDEAADSVVEYGLDATYGLSVSAAAPVTAHQVALNSAFLTPQTLLHFRVKSTDSVGNVTTGTDQTLQLPGVSVTVVVRGPDGKPQAGVSVTLDGSTGITDSQGRVTLASSLGNKKIVSNYQGVTIQKPITVAKTTKPLPPYQLDLGKQPINQWMLSSVGLLALVLILLIIDAFLFGSKILARLTGLHFLHRPHLPQLHHQTAGPGMAAPAPTPTPEPPPPRPAPIIAESPAPPAPAVLSVSTPSEPPVDASRTVADLMGEPAVSSPTAAAQAVTKIAVTDSAPPLEVILEPLPLPAKPVKLPKSSKLKIAKKKSPSRTHKK